MAEHIRLGRRAEASAREFLKQHGYLIIAERYRWRSGEIDLIAREANCLVFIEVKSRSNHSHGLPEEAITPKKRRKLVLTAQCYLLDHPTNLDTRFDVVALSQGKLRLYKNAFGLSDF